MQKPIRRHSPTRPRRCGRRRSGATSPLCLRGWRPLIRRFAPPSPTRGEGRKEMRFPIQLSNSVGPRVCILAARSPELCFDGRPPLRTRGRRESRVRAAPTVSCAKVHKKRTRADRSSGGNPAFPARWFTGLYRALLGDRAFLPPSLRGTLPAQLDASVGASGPHGFAVRAALRSSFRKPRVHRIPPRVRDDRDPPLSSGETRGAMPVICPTC